MSGALLVNLHEPQLAGNDSPFPILGGARASLDRVLDIDQGAHRLAEITTIDQYGAALEQVMVPLKDQVSRGIQQRMPGTYEGGGRFALRIEELLFEGDPLIAGQYRFAGADLPVSSAVSLPEL